MIPRPKRSDCPSPPLAISDGVCKLLSDPSLLAHLFDIVSVVDRDLRFVYVSRGVRSHPAELIGRSVLDTLGEHDRLRFRQACDEALSSASPQTIIANDTQGGWWESRLVPARDERMQPFLLMASVDISALKRAEQQLREREQRQHSAMASSGVGTWSWDPIRDAVTWDRGVFHIFGREPSSQGASHREFLAFVHPEDRATVEANLRSCLATGVYGELEHRLVRPDGEVRHVVCRGTAAVDAQGRVVLVSGGVFDVTERRRLEEQLRHVQKMEAVGQLTAGIAHNFNNLLSIALPNVELLRARAPAELQGLVDDVLHAADRAIELVRQLMRIARQEVGAPRVSTDIAAIALHTARVCRNTFDRRIDISVYTEPGLPSVSARAGEIEQVLLNICINARDAFEEAKTPDPRLRIAIVRGDAGTVRITISDNGPGMDEETRSRLFEPFFTTKEISKGTGLGLASAYAIVIDHQGTIRCESGPGAGSTFVIDFPAAREPAAEQKRPEPAAACGGSEGVLLIDDEALVRRALRAVLEQAGFQVFEAGDGSEGLSQLRHHVDAIDVILLDRSMPGVSGDEFLARLGPERSRIPIVLLTGHASEADLDGVDAVMIKPPRSGELLEAIRSVLDARTPLPVQAGGG